MAFIKNKNLEIGQRVVTTRNIESFSGIFEKGTEVTLISIDSHRGYGIQDDEGNTMIECGWDCIASI